MHHLPARAEGLDEAVLGVVQVLEQVTDEERLALAAEADRGVELGAKP